ncbi:MULTISPECIES: TolC family protein [unclassified Polaromonas]|uniref:TolC family protein n=1 Tax=unclassified Polaromonas TaxID=2638319 RepID=UPI0018C97E0D|nr:MULTISPECIES: TolC family protein [unclassified Polaromonas]MBG6073809.1 outer membrane protein TolC [Polaromonas sp. CG_9.7]MBG6115889.1 outer membrane protein TolC [Polaromonas sp. CG_9.2]MDH6185957.1 outer membrane protein TolC [Polaromonas sp. CG_23.6]
MKRIFRLTALATASLVLAGCASVNMDQAVRDTNDTTSTFTQGKLELSRTEQQARARARLSSELLANPLGMDEAVQLALANSPAVQTLLAQSWSDMAQANQTGRIANPVFSFERIRFADELELGRLLSFGLLDLLTLPRRLEISEGQMAQARVQLSANVVEQVTQVRQAWVRAVAAQQSLAYAHQVNLSAKASAELARRMRQVGNFTKLQRARHQSFYADSAAQLASSQQASTAAREDLIRQLGLTEAQVGQLKLPERLPDLPKAPVQAAVVNANAPDQRLDVKIARNQLEMAGKSQGLNLITSLVDVELGVRRDTVFDNAAGTSTPRKGFELDIRLPIFDWGTAKRDAMNAQSLAAANRYESTVRGASSQLRESYSAYRTAYDVARHYRDEIVPLRQVMAEENILRYNGMLIGVFELLADNRDQIASITAALNAYQQFWLADAALAASMTGKPTASAMAAPMAGGSGGNAAGH